MATSKPKEVAPSASGMVATYHVAYSTLPTHAHDAGCSAVAYQF